MVFFNLKELLSYVWAYKPYLANNNDLYMKIEPTSLTLNDFFQFP